MTHSIDLSKYTCDAVDCVEFKLIRDKKDLRDDSIVFKPEMSHQIFGQEEKIFGYKDLQISLDYTAGPMYFNFGYKCSRRVNELPVSLEPDNIGEAIDNALPDVSYFTNIDEFSKMIARNEEFRPFGEKKTAFEVVHENKKRYYEIYKADIADPKFQVFYDRFQTLILWFVDAACFIDLEDTQWTIFIAYEKYKSSSGNNMYATAGLATIYHYYAYPEHQRSRISQMFVLPPFQKCGIGTKFIETIYNFIAANPKIKDITVEDPSENFTRIRNYVDAKLCMKLESFAPEKLKLGFSEAMAKEAEERCKITKKQSRIVYEILRLRCTNVNIDKEYTAFRLDVKRRINTIYYRQKSYLKKLEEKGIDITTQMALLPTVDERLEQLVAEYRDIEEDYKRILQRLEDDDV